MTWEDYVLDSYIIFDSKTNPLRSSPTNDGPIIYRFNDHFFKGEEIVGDWVKIKCNNDCKICDNINLSGWIRWRNGRFFLIQLGIIC